MKNSEKDLSAYVNTENAMQSIALTKDIIELVKSLNNVYRIAMKLKISSRVAKKCIFILMEKYSKSRITGNENHFIGLNHAQYCLEENPVLLALFIHDKSCFGNKYHKKTVLGSPIRYYKEFISECLRSSETKVNDKTEDNTEARDQRTLH